MASDPQSNGHTPEALKLAGPLLPQDADAVEHWFNIVQCLLPVYDGNKMVRKDGSLTIRPSGCYWQAVLRCPTEGRECSVEASSLAEVFDLLEATLRQGRANWRPDYDSRKKVGRVKGG